jgi:PHD/YefM family antitoxin component YafN of YafNO toxin-antitoxin module
MYAIMYANGRSGDTMGTVTATTFRKNLFGLLSETISSSVPLQVTTKDGNAVVLSETDYNAMQETVYLLSVPGMRESIVEGMKTPIEDCIPESAVQW